VGTQDNDNNGLCSPTCASSGMGNCSARGTCSDATGTALCACTTGYQGNTCGTCALGYQDNDSNTSCLPTCATSGLGNCSAHGTCADATGTALCFCVAGYQGTTCGTCTTGYQDNDNNGTCVANCATSGLGTCGGHGTCVDNTGVALCSCAAGYQGATCGACAAGYQDNDNNGTCLPTCATSGLGNCSGHGTCSDTSGTAQCSCPFGWSGATCGNPTFVWVSAGGLHSCGLRANGSVQCWGSPAQGQTTPPPGLVANDVASGTYFSCALPTAGGVKCWGDAIGTGSTPMDSQPGKPTTGQFVAIHAGNTFACAQDAAGLLTCFGPNRPFVTQANTFTAGFSNDLNGARIDLAGNLFNVGNIPALPPVNTTPPGGYAALDCGENFCCAIKETRATNADRLQGGVQCWGSNAPTSPFQTAGRVLNAPAVTEPYAVVSTGDYNACAIQSTPAVPTTDLRLKCWGSATNGVVTGAPSGAYVALSVGTFHACAVDLAGVIRCWGDNASGQAPGVVF
jgi:hypothetical protein